MIVIFRISSLCNTTELLTSSTLDPLAKSFELRNSHFFPQAGGV